MNKFAKKSFDFTIKQLERASRYIVISGLIIAVILQLTVYSQWGRMLADAGQALISISGIESVSAEYDTQEQGL